MNRIFSIFILTFCLSTVCLAVPFTVTKIADTNDGVCDADCSLREAVAAANAASGDDSVVFDPTVFGAAQTITLTAGSISITRSEERRVGKEGRCWCSADDQNEQ